MTVEILMQVLATVEDKTVQVELAQAGTLYTVQVDTTTQDTKVRLFGGGQVLDSNTAESDIEQARRQR